MADLICPDCNTVIERKYGLPAIIAECPKCHKEWVKLLDRLVERGEFHKEADAWHN